MARIDDAAAGGRGTGRTDTPDPAKIVLDGIWDWIRARSHQGPLPAPCPPGYEDAARWWVAAMCEPERPGETRQIATGDNGIRWDCGYAVCCRQSFLTWLDMTRLQKDAVIAAVREDGIPYRGERFEAFMGICGETLRMREDRDTYIASALRRIRDVTERIGGTRRREIAHPNDRFTARPDQVAQEGFQHARD